MALGLTAGSRLPQGRLEMSEDARQWTCVVQLVGGPFGGNKMSSYSFSPVRARYFRLVLERPLRSLYAAFMNTPDEPTVQLAEVNLSATARVHRWHEKAQFVRISSAGMRESHVHDVAITKEAPNYRVS